MAEAGWYPDPYTGGGQRYFDGAQWTGEAHPDGGARPGGGPGPAAATGRGRAAFIGVAAVIILGLIVSGLVFVLRGTAPSALTYQGRAIAQPAQALTTAEANLAAVVRSRHGAENGSTRCYYELPRKRPAGEKTSDVASSLLCGPVLFVDGHPGQAYLTFGLTSSSASGGQVALSPSPRPASGDPVALTSRVTLRRPDGRQPPGGTGGLAAPAPPPAEPNVLVSTSLGPATIPAAPAGAVIGSLNGGMRLADLGRVGRYGTGDSARAAPSGQKLIAFAVVGAENNNGDIVSLVDSATLVVDKGTPRRLPPPTAKYYVAAVPLDAASVDVVVTDAGHTQTLSLLTGRPGPDNIAVLARSHRTDTRHSTQDVALTFSQPVLENGASFTSETASVTVSGAALLFWAPPSNATPANLASAYLVPDIALTDPHEPGTTFERAVSGDDVHPAGQCCHTGDQPVDHSQRVRQRVPCPRQHHVGHADLLRELHRALRRWGRRLHHHDHHTGDRAAQLPGGLSVELSEAAFEQLVADALDAIPEELGRRMDNVAVTVADWPTRQQLGGRSGTLLGLYEGVDLTRRSPLSYGATMPDRITIFKGPLTRLAGDEAELVRMVTTTVIHEVAHHFGISDDRLKELGWA